MKRATLDALLEARRARHPVALVSALGDTRQWLVDPRQTNPDVPPVVVSAARDALSSDRSERRELDGQPYFVHAFTPPPKLVVVGAVHIAQALCPMAARVGFDVRVVDPRRGYASQARFPNAQLDTRWPADALSDPAPDAHTAVVALTHDPKLDEPALIAALHSNAFYVGALGSRRTHAARLQRLQDAGIGPAECERVHGPVGLDIGAQGAAEIAASIVAQLIQLRRTRIARGSGA